MLKRAYLFPDQRLLLVLVLWLAIGAITAQSHLVTLEGQLAGSYNSLDSELNPWTHHPHEVMQKPSVGLDYTGRLGSPHRSIANLALQLRLAWDENADSNLGLHIYNAYLKLKGRNYDLWLGHNKPAFGLNQGLDNHALLLPDNSMSGLVFDRDWGAGIDFDKQELNLNLSIGTGSGMPLETEGSWQASGRLGWGDFSRDNLALGVSASTGKVLHTMGYEVMHGGNPLQSRLAGADLSLRFLNYSLQADYILGSFNRQDASALLLRLSGNYLADESLVVDAQLSKREFLGRQTDSYSAGLTWKASPYLSFRTAYTFNDQEEYHQIALQLYYLRALIF